MIQPVNSSNKPSYANEIIGGALSITIAVATFVLAYFGVMKTYTSLCIIVGSSLSSAFALLSLVSFCIKKASESKVTKTDISQPKEKPASSPHESVSHHQPTDTPLPQRTGRPLPQKSVSHHQPTEMDSRDFYTRMLKDFYTAEGTDCEGRTFEEVLQLMDSDYGWVEETHNWVQWAFPSNRKSVAVGTDPELTKEIVETIQRSPVAMLRVKKAFNLYLRFLGMKYDERSKTVEINADGNDLMALSRWRNGAWLKSDFPHNYLRFSRILNFLSIVGLKNEARAFNAILQKIAAADGQGVFHIQNESRGYWQNASTSRPHLRSAPSLCL